MVNVVISIATPNPNPEQHTHTHTPSGGVAAGRALVDVKGPPPVRGGRRTWLYAARTPRSLRRATTTPVVGGVKWEGGSCVARCPRPADVGPIRCDCMYRSRNTTRQPVRPLTGGGIWLRARRNRTFTMCGGVALRGGVAKQKDRWIDITGV